MNSGQQAAIAALLVAEGQRIVDSRKQPIKFTGNREADRLLNDLKRSPHAFILACVMDRQMKAEKAWIIPHRIRQRLGTFELSELKKLSERKFLRLMTRPTPLHRFPNEMSHNLFAAVSLISERYGGDAANIWRDRPSSAMLVCRLLEFRGVGPKIATMTANILVRQFKVKLADYYSIDVSVDVQIRRVLKRLGLVSQRATNDQIVYSARSMSPQFPGLVDSPAWRIGREWCKPRVPECGECFMNELCPSRC